MAWWWNRPRILLVCKANLCRSTMAEALLKAKLHQRGMARAYRVDSAGTQVGIRGRKPDARTVKVLTKKGVSVAGIKSRGITSKDFLRCDYILAMDQEVYTELEQRSPANAVARLAKVLDYSQVDTGGDVPDPYFGNGAGFEVVADRLEVGLDGFIDSVLQPRRDCV